VRAAKCKRPDCGEAPRRGDWCPTHGRQVRRTGSPYRRDELDDMSPVNSYQREMDAALEADVPFIRWEKNRRGVWIAVEVDDPHAEGRRTPAEAARSNELRRERRRKAREAA
jgi:hypothetical protein